MKNDNVRIFWTTITPEEAEGYLGNNFEENRGLRPERVRLYMQLFKDGRWDPYAAEPITISDTGKVMNGQHRLAAVIKSGVPLFTEMRTGVPESTYRYFDCGLNRTASDGIPAGTKNKSTVMAVCRAAVAIGASGDAVITTATINSGNNKTSMFISNASVCEFFDKCNELYPGVLAEVGCFADSAAIKSTKWTKKSVGISSLAMSFIDIDAFHEFRDAILDDTNTMVSVIAYKKWANDHDLKSYSSQERVFIEWCAAANVWAELHGHTPRRVAYKKGLTGEMIGFKTEMFDLLGNRKHKDGENE